MQTTWNYETHQFHNGFSSHGFFSAAFFCSTFLQIKLLNVSQLVKLRSADFRQFFSVCAVHRMCTRESPTAASCLSFGTMPLYIPTLTAARLCTQRPTLLSCHPSLCPEKVSQVRQLCLHNSLLCLFNQSKKCKQFPARFLWCPQINQKIAPKIQQAGICFVTPQRWCERYSTWSQHLLLATSIKEYPQNMNIACLAICYVSDS